MRQVAAASTILTPLQYKGQWSTASDDSKHQSLLPVWWGNDDDYDNSGSESWPISNDEWRSCDRQPSITSSTTTTTVVITSSTLGGSPWPSLNRSYDADFDGHNCVGSSDEEFIYHTSLLTITSSSQPTITNLNGTNDNNQRQRRSSGKNERRRNHPLIRTSNTTFITPSGPAQTIASNKCRPSSRVSGFSKAFRRRLARLTTNYI